MAKLHAISRIPRRWEAEFERQATHSSLARRIQAIRAASGMGLQSLGPAVGFAATDGSLSVTFHEDRVLWNEGESASHSLSYGHLAELRLDARRSGAPRLLAVDRNGRRWEMALSDADVARAQGVLDIVDARLAAPAPPLSVSPAVARWFAILVILCSLPATYVTPMIAAAFAILRPAPPLVGAAGAAAVMAAGLTWRDHVLSGAQDSYVWLAASLLIWGLMLLGIAIANREKQHSGTVSKLVGALGICAILAWSAVLLTGVDALSLHSGVRAWPAATILPLSLATAIACWRTRKACYSSIAIALVGVAACFVGSTTFVDSFGRDPFLAAAESLTFTTISAPLVAECSVPFQATEMRLSPSGRHVALASEDANEQTTFHVGPTDGPLRTFDADDALFVGEDRLLLLTRQRDDVRLQMWALDSAELVWERQLSGVRSWHLSFDTSANHWDLLLWHPDGHIVGVRGRVGTAAVEEVGDVGNDDDEPAEPALCQPWPVADSA